MAIKMRIQTGNWEENTLTLADMPKSFVLSARPIMVLELEEAGKLAEEAEKLAGRIADLQAENKALKAQLKRIAMLAKGKTDSEIYQIAVL